MHQIVEYPYEDEFLKYISQEKWLKHLLEGLFKKIPINYYNGNFLKNPPSQSAWLSYQIERFEDRNYPYYYADISLKCFHKEAALAKANLEKVQNCLFQNVGYAFLTLKEKKSHSEIQGHLSCFSSLLEISYL